MAKSVTMNEIAQTLGVSKSTVSLALRNDPRISPQVRAKIQRVAEKMGYRYNPLVARLMHELRLNKNEGTQATLALVNCSTLQDIRDTNRTVLQISQGVEERAHQLGYSIDTFWLRDPELKIKRLLNILRARNIQGVILHSLIGCDLAKIDPEGLLWSHFPCVTAGARLRNPALSFAINDHYATGHIIGKNLSELGYRRVGIVIDSGVDTLIEGRFAYGLLASQGLKSWSNNSIKHLKTPFREPYMEQNKQDYLAWLDRFKPDAICCLNSQIYKWTLESGRKVPEDLGIAFLDISRNSPQNAGTNQQQDQIGVSSVDLVIGHILRHEISPPPIQRGITIESIWKPGGTVCKQMS